MDKALEGLDNWKTTPPDAWEPDPKPDTETYPEIVQRVKEALYQALEDRAADYHGKDSRLLDMLEVSLWILKNDDIRECCECGDYSGAADDIAFALEQQFGAESRRQMAPSDRATFFVDPNLASLVQWIKRRGGAA